MELETWKLAAYKSAVCTYFIIIGIGYWLQRKSQGLLRDQINEWSKEIGFISRLKPVVKVVPIILLAINVRLLVAYDLTPLLSFYRKWIFWGLLASAVGDVSLAYDRYEIGGPLFATAHICYISAFGFSSSGGLLLAAGFFAVWLLAARTAEGSFADDSGIKGEIIKRGVQLYAMMLCTMSWRATARFVDHRSVPNLLCCIGSVFFVVSDSLIAIHMKQGTTASRVNLFRRDLRVMLTYYIAQFCIEHSAVEDDIPLYAMFAGHSNVR
jgi:uncharacterized membrane protein YhhN